MQMLKCKNKHLMTSHFGTLYLQCVSFFSTGSQQLAITCNPQAITGQYQCNTPAVVSIPVAQVTGGTGTVSAVTYIATGATFGTPVNNQVTGTFPAPTGINTVTAFVSDASGIVSCTYSVSLIQGILASLY